MNLIACRKDLLIGLIVLPLSLVQLAAQTAQTPSGSGTALEPRCAAIAAMDP